MKNERCGQMYSVPMSRWDHLNKYKNPEATGNQLHNNR